jgi:hypothetical protein
MTLTGRPEGFAEVKSHPVATQVVGFPQRNAFNDRVRKAYRYAIRVQNFLFQNATLALSLRGGRSDGPRPRPAKRITFRPKNLVHVLVHT